MLLWSGLVVNQKENIVVILTDDTFIDLFFICSLLIHYLFFICSLVRNLIGTLDHEGVHRVLKIEPSKMSKVADFFVREMATAVPVVPSVIFSSIEKVCLSFLNMSFSFKYVFFF